jgi:hypothetical protein
VIENYFSRASKDNVVIGTDYGHTDGSSEVGRRQRRAIISLGPAPIPNWVPTNG